MIKKCEMGGEHICCDRCFDVLDCDHRGAPLRYDLNGVPVGNLGTRIIGGQTFPDNVINFCRPCHDWFFGEILEKYTRRQALADVHITQAPRHG